MTVLLFSYQYSISDSTKNIFEPDFQKDKFFKKVNQSQAKCIYEKKTNTYKLMPRDEIKKVLPFDKYAN
jgi:hypothetical protein